MKSLIARAAIAVLLAGMMLQPICGFLAGALAGAFASLLMERFKTMGGRDVKWTPLELVVNLAVIVVLWTGFLFAREFPMLAVASTALSAGFMGWLVVGVSTFVYSSIVKPKE